MAKYKVIVTARSFGKTDSKARELLEEDGCSVIKLEEADGPISVSYTHLIWSPLWQKIVLLIFCNTYRPDDGIVL